MAEPTYRRVIVKLSGEASRRLRRFRHRPADLHRIAGDLVAAHELGVELGVVVGGGNILRGVEVSHARRVARRPATPWACSPP